MEKITDKNYNWWTDPANKEEVERISWWNHEQNKATIPLPVSIVESNGSWTVSGNEMTEKLLGKGLVQCGSGKSKEEAIKVFFLLMKLGYEYEATNRRKYEKWVPFLKGPWRSTGGKWFQIFGINVYFRYGKNVKHGRYIPFTKLNIRINSLWNNPPQD